MPTRNGGREGGREGRQDLEAVLHPKRRRQERQQGEESGRGGAGGQRARQGFALRCVSAGRECRKGGRRQEGRVRLCPLTLTDHAGHASEHATDAAAAARLGWGRSGGCTKGGGREGGGGGHEGGQSSGWVHAWQVVTCGLEQEGRGQRGCS